MSNYRFSIAHAVLAAATTATLLVPRGVGGAGLPGQYLLQDGWRTLAVEHSPLTNPAFMTEENYIALRMALSTVLSNFRSFEAGVVIPIGLHQSAGITWAGQGASSFPQTSIEDGAITLTGRDVGDQHHFFMASWAINPWRSLSLGINLNVAHQSLYGVQRNTAPGVDAGLTWRLVRHPLVGTHTAGIMLQNAFAPAFASGETYASSLDITLRGSYLENRLGSYIGFSVLDLFAPEAEFAGSPASRDWSVQTRLDVWVVRMAKLYALAHFNRDGVSSAGFGAGVNVPSLNAGRDMEFLYQYLSVSDANHAHSAYARGHVGRHREEIYARTMANRFNVAPNELYTRALELYSRGRYWDAFFLFSRLAHDYPDFFRNDWVTYYRGSCMEELDLRTSAYELYTTTRDRFDRSDVLGPTLLGMMRIRYRQENTLETEALMQELGQPLISDSIRSHGYYLLGQNALGRGENSKARSALERVPPHHPDFVFAQHSLAVLSLRTNDTEQAIDHLQESIQAQSLRLPAQTEMVNRSYLLLGLLFYEESGEIESGLAKAVSALRQIPSSSYYYENALMGLGWCALKARQWSDCIAAGRELQSRGSTPVTRAEGLLLQAYAQLNTNNASGAENLLSEAARLAESYAGPNQKAQQERLQHKPDLRREYEQSGQRAIELARLAQSGAVLASVDSLGTVHRRLHDELRAHRRALDTHDRELFFARTWDQIREDITFAHAHTLSHEGAKKLQQTRETLKQETLEIDSEIRRLEEQLQLMEGEEPPVGDQ